MKRKRLVAACLLQVLALDVLFAADDAPWTPQEFEQVATKLRSNPDAHAALITECIDMGYSELEKSNDFKQQLTRLNSMDPKEGVREMCRRLVKGLASGKLSYELYRRWLRQDVSTLPDWR